MFKELSLQATITEAYRQCQKFESLQTHQFKTAGEAQNASYSKIVQPFVEYSLDDRRHIEQAIGEMTQLMNRVRAKTKRSNGTAQQPQGNVSSRFYIKIPTGNFREYRPIRWIPRKIVFLMHVAAH